MGVSVGTLDHFNIRTRNLGDTVRFYQDVLGLEAEDIVVALRPRM